MIGAAAAAVQGGGWSGPGWCHEAEEDAGVEEARPADGGQEPDGVAKHGQEGGGVPVGIGISRRWISIQRPRAPVGCLYWKKGQRTGVALYIYMCVCVNTFLCR